MTLFALICATVLYVGSVGYLAVLYWQRITQHRFAAFPFVMTLGAATNGLLTAPGSWMSVTATVTIDTLAFASLLLGLLRPAPAADEHANPGDAAAVSLTKSP